uniref:Uncharacterized protein n=2 Tax=Chenopodium quinoa TaxID=63459 RepID=A0A803N4V1_CHEQI
MEVPTTFGGEDAAEMVTELWRNFVSGKTRSYDWRVTQLKSIVKNVKERETEIVDALRSYINKPEFESVLFEDIKIGRWNMEDAEATTARYGIQVARRLGVACLWLEVT